MTPSSKEINVFYNPRLNKFGSSFWGLHLIDEHDPDYFSVLEVSLWYLFDFGPDWHFVGYL